MASQAITYRQAVMWFVMYQVGSAFLVLPSSLAAAAGQDAWLSIMATVGIQLLLIPMYAAIAKQCGSKSFADYLCELWGGTAARLFLFVFALSVPFLIFNLTLRNLGDFVTTTLMPETPVDPLYLLMLAAVVYVVWCGIAVIGRVAELLFFIVFIMFIVLTISLFPQFEANSLLPVLEYGWKPVVRGSFPLLAFPYLESVLFLFIFPHISVPSARKRLLVTSTLLSGVMFLVVTTVTIGVLGVDVAADLTFPSYFVIRTISIANFYERFEVLVTILWFITMFFRLALLMHITAHIMGSVFGLRSSRVVLIPLSLVALNMTNIIFPNLPFLFNFFQVWPLYALLFGTAMPASIWLTGRLKEALSS